MVNTARDIILILLTLHHVVVWWHARLSPRGSRGDRWSGLTSDWRSHHTHVSWYMSLATNICTRLLHECLWLACSLWLLLRWLLTLLLRWQLWLLHRHAGNTPSHLLSLRITHSRRLRCGRSNTQQRRIP